MMFRRSQRFPIISGDLIALARAGLATRGWSTTGLTIRTERPTGTTSDPLTRRMVSIRDDGGAQLGRIQSRRQGVNVWADSPVDAENICLDLISVFEGSADGDPLAACYGFSSPIKIPADVPLVVGGKNLTNYYFAFLADVKAASA